MLAMVISNMEREESFKSRSASLRRYMIFGVMPEPELISHRAASPKAASICDHRAGRAALASRVSYTTYDSCSWAYHSVDGASPAAGATVHGVAV